MTNTSTPWYIHLKSIIIWKLNQGQMHPRRDLGKSSKINKTQFRFENHNKYGYYTPAVEKQLSHLSHGTHLTEHISPDEQKFQLFSSQGE